MSENNNIKRFTAADVEKYQKGLLSAKEKHDLEKAALDDPFLADALEGYTTAGVYVSDDMKDLNERLAERVNEKRKVIAMPTERRQRFALWKVAAIIILIAGAGFLVYQLGFNKKENSIAETSSKKNEPSTDTSAPLKDSQTQEISSGIVNTEKAENKIEPKEERTVTTKTNVGASRKKSDTVFINGISSQLNSSPNLSPDKDLKEQEVAKSFNNAPVNQLSKPKADDIKATNPVALNNIPESNKNNARESTINGFTTSDKLFVENKRSEKYIAPNIFRGRVLDANNNPVPFANITNIADSVGTYADARGNFNFISSDTTMNVEIRSVGFNNINTQLRNRVLDNQVVLQEDRSLSARILLDTARSNAIKRLHPAKKDDEEEFEPEDGWGLYDTYVINNLRVPNDLKTKPAKGEVEVSFEVDRNGEPTNFKITKSLSDACDKEAIRLIKEGPKWKKKARKGRATVTVSF